MEKIHTLLELIFQRGEMNIYRRILRTALWGSCVTFMVMGGIFLVSIFILHNELHEQGRDVSGRMGDYLEENFQQEVKVRLTETTALRAQIVGRLLKNCSLNVENLADTLTDTLQNDADWEHWRTLPSVCPVCN